MCPGRKTLQDEVLVRRVFRDGERPAPACFREVAKRKMAEDRSCLMCIHRYPCQMAGAIDDFPARWLRIGPEEEGGAPLRRINLYETLAGCFLFIKEREGN